MSINLKQVLADLVKLDDPAVSAGVATAVVAGVSSLFGAHLTVTNLAEIFGGLGALAKVAQGVIVQKQQPAK